ncbi:MAG: thiolase family protein [Actinomycetales bacterium]
MTSPLGERTPVVIAARRTPVGSAGHGLADLDVVDLAAPVLRAVVDDVLALGVREQIGDVLLGNTRGPGGNIARVAALAAGLGTGVPGATLDRQCGSGQAAIHWAGEQILSGAADLVIAGGAESASTQPTTLLGDPPVAYNRAPFAPAGFDDPEMGLAAQRVADEAGISRERQDAYAVRSHERALASMASGVELAELVPLAGLSQDERPRRLRPAVLARMPGAFSPGGSITSANSCGVSDAAAAVAVVPECVRRELGVPGLALRAWSSVGVEPGLPGLGPVPAVRAVLRRTGYAWPDVAAVEITEAFAGQVLACTDQWGLDPLGADDDRVCVQGGAIARGHPWGASGALLVVRLFSQFVRSAPPAPRSSIGVATCAVGGGQGLALLVERVG